MHRHDRTALALIFWVILAFGSHTLDITTLRVVVWCPLLFFIPGRLYLNVLGIDFCCEAEAILLSVCLSIANIIAGGLILGVLHLLHPFWWGAWLTATSALPLSRISVASSRRQVHGLSVSRIGVTPPQAGVIGLAALGLVIAFVIALHDERSERRFRYTELWMTPQSNPEVMTVGVRNAEGSDAAYELELLVDSATIAALPPLSLVADATWTNDFRVPPLRKGQHRFEVRLFKDGDHNRLYRRAFANINAVGGA